MADFNLVQEPGTYDSTYYADANSSTNSNQSNSFDFNTISSGVSSIASPLFNFIEGMYAISQGQHAPNNSNGGVVYVQPQPQQGAGSSQTLMYIAGGIFFLLVLGLIIYAIKKN